VFFDEYATAGDRAGSSAAVARISSCLSQLRCNIEIALIDTEGQMAIDTFYLTSEGKKLSVDLQKKVQKALLHELKGLELA
jgi:[protein-PII] uridylyltransferase